MTCRLSERYFLIHTMEHTYAHVNLPLSLELQIVLGIKLFFKLSSSELRTFLKKVSVSSYEMFRSELSSITKSTVVKRLVHCSTVFIIFRSNQSSVRIFVFT